MNRNAPGRARRLFVLAALASVIAATAATGAAAQMLPAPQNVLQLTADASAEVQQDLLTITLASNRDGADAANLDLSKRRAAAVLKALTTRGIETTRMESEGYGESKPVADNKTKAGKAINRRVELAIVDMGQ